MLSTKSKLPSFCTRLTEILVNLDKVTPIDDSIAMYEDVCAELMCLAEDLRDYIILNYEIEAPHAE